MFTSDYFTEYYFTERYFPSERNFNDFVVVVIAPTYTDIEVFVVSINSEITYEQTINKEIITDAII